MELVDVVDSKSTAGDSVPVRVRSPAPKRIPHILWNMGDFCNFFGENKNEHFVCFLSLVFIWCLLDADTSAAYGLRERVFERFCGCSFDRLQGMGIQVTGDTDGRMPKVRGYSLDASPFGNQQSSVRVS